MTKIIISVLNLALVISMAIMLSYSDMSLETRVFVLTLAYTVSQILFFSLLLVSVINSDAGERRLG